MQVPQVAFAVMASMFFLKAARDGEHVTVLMHERCAHYAILFPLRVGIIGLLDKIYIFHIVRDSTFNAAQSFRVFHLMCQIDWSWTDWFNTDGVRDPFLNFNFEGGML